MSKSIPFFAPSTFNLPRSQWTASDQYLVKVFISTARSQNYRRVATPRRCRTHNNIISAAASRQPPDADGYKQMEDMFGPSGKSGKKFQKKPSQPRKDPLQSKVTSYSDMDVRDGPRQSAESGETSDTNAYDEMAGIFGAPSSRFQKKNQAGNAPSSSKKVSNSAEEGSAAPRDPSISSEKDIPQIPEEDFSDDAVELSPEDLAAQYEEMSQLLGPPTGRFRRETEKENTRGKANSAPDYSDTRASNSDTDSGVKAESKEEQEQPLMRQVENAQEEFELIRSALRGGEASNKPRRGRRYATEATKLEGIVTEPFRTSYNLMPMKGPKPKRGPPGKGQKPLTLPKDYVFAIESIEQSYWALERVLEEEEEDWKEEQERLRQEKLEKLQAKEERRRLRNGEPPTDASVQGVGENEAVANATQAEKGKSQDVDGIFGCEVINSLEKPASKKRRVRTTTKAERTAKSTVAPPRTNATHTKPTTTLRKTSKQPGVLLLRNPKLIAQTE